MRRSPRSRKGRKGRHLAGSAWPGRAATAVDGPAVSATGGRQMFSACRAPCPAASCAQGSRSFSTEGARDARLDADTSLSARTATAACNEAHSSTAGRAAARSSGRFGRRSLRGTVEETRYVTLADSLSRPPSASRPMMSGMAVQTSSSSRGATSGRLPSASPLRRSQRVVSDGICTATAAGRVREKHLRISQHHLEWRMPEACIAEFPSGC